MSWTTRYPFWYETKASTVLWHSVESSLLSAPTGPTVFAEAAEHSDAHTHVNAINPFHLKPHPTARFACSPLSIININWLYMQYMFVRVITLNHISHISPIRWSPWICFKITFKLNWLEISLIEWWNDWILVYTIAYTQTENRLKCVDCLRSETVYLMRWTCGVVSVRMWIFVCVWVSVISICRVLSICQPNRFCMPKLEHKETHLMTPHTTPPRPPDVFRNEIKLVNK